MSNEIKNTHDVEKALATYYQSPEPSPEFITWLESQIQEPGENKKPRSSIRIKKMPKKKQRISWAFAPVMLALVLVIVVAAIGPQKVLAQVQSWLGYIPGFGFAEADQVRIIAEPVTITKDGITVTIKQVYSNDENTYVIISVEKLPPKGDILEQLFLDFGPITPENQAEWQERYHSLWQTDARLIMSDGTVISDQYYQGSYWEGYFTFPWLPEGELDLTFAFTRLPGIPEGRYPEGWEFDISLSYADDVDGVDLPVVIPVDAPSAPITAEPTELPYKDLRVVVVDAVYAATETAVRVDIQGIPDDWMLSEQMLNGTLRDDLGNEYQVIFGPGSGIGPDGYFVLIFEPVSPEAKQLTLEISHIGFVIPLEGQSLVVDFGSEPQVDDIFTLDSTIDVLGIPIPFKSLWVHYETKAFIPEETHLLTYEFETERIPIINGIMVTGFRFSPEVLELLGSHSGGAGGGGGGGGGGAGGGGGGPIAGDEEFYTFNMSISVPVENPLPTGLISFPIEGATIQLLGPFTITWDVGGSE